MTQDETKLLQGVYSNINSVIDRMRKYKRESYMQLHHNHL